MAKKVKDTKKASVPKGVGPRKSGARKTNDKSQRKVEGKKGITSPAPKTCISVNLWGKRRKATKGGNAVGGLRIFLEPGKKKGS